MTCQQYEEVALELREAHILALDRDEDAVREALRSVAKNKRPKIKAEVIERVGSLERSGLRSNGLWSKHVFFAIWSRRTFSK